MDKEKLRKSLLGALFDTGRVLAYSGLPATGVIAFLAVVQQDIEGLARYSPYIASGVNLVAFYVKRVYDYYTGRKELKI